MEHISIACVGKVKEAWARDGIAEYTKRLSRYCRLAFLEVADEPTKEGAGAKQEERVRKLEGDRLLSVIPSDAYVITLEIRGKALDSVGLADRLETLAGSGKSHIVFVIGGSLGLSREVRERADLHLSFSAMTFPHQLMRLILTEQIYRAFRIRRNEPYHK
jgi:23S rRNA (pseudouridine1915-N3)-methyltransferase